MSNLEVLTEMEETLGKNGARRRDVLSAEPYRQIGMIKKAKF